MPSDSHRDTHTDSHSDSRVRAIHIRTRLDPNPFRAEAPDPLWAEDWAGRRSDYLSVIAYALVQTYGEREGRRLFQDALERLGVG